MLYHKHNIIHIQEPFSETDNNKFSASNGWLSNFCGRTGIKSRAIYVEKGSSDYTGAEIFVEDFNNKSNFRYTFTTRFGICLV